MKKFVIIISAVLAIAGSAEARPRGFVNPEPEPAKIVNGEFPAEYRGKWCPTDNATIYNSYQRDNKCSEDARFTVSAKSISWFESGCELLEGVSEAHNFQGLFSCGGEGITWAIRILFIMGRDGKLIEEDGADLRGPLDFPIKGACEKTANCQKEKKVDDRPVDECGNPLNPRYGEAPTSLDQIHCGNKKQPTMGDAPRWMKK